MNKFFAEYGRFLVAIVGSAFLFYMYTTMIGKYKDYSEEFIKAITGVDQTSYEETVEEAGD